MNKGFVKCLQKERLIDSAFFCLTMHLGYGLETIWFYHMISMQGLEQPLS